MWSAQPLTRALSHAAPCLALRSPRGWRIEEWSSPISFQKGMIFTHFWKKGWVHPPKKGWSSAVTLRSPTHALSCTSLTSTLTNGWRIPAGWRDGPADAIFHQVAPRGSTGDWWRHDFLELSLAAILNWGAGWANLGNRFINFYFSLNLLSQMLLSLCSLKINESNALTNWQRQMLQRKKQQQHLSSKLLTQLHTSTAESLPWS